MRWRARTGWDDAACCRCYTALPAGSDEPPTAEPRRRRAVPLGGAVLLSGLSALLASAATAWTLSARPRPGGASPVLAVEEAGTRAPAPPPAVLERALRAEHLFAELTTLEVRAVAQYTAAFLGCSTGYKGTGAAALKGCFLSGSEAVTLRLPNKDEALAHLDGGSPAPPRMAEVIVVHGNKPVEEGVGIYLVGPLDGEKGFLGNPVVTLLRSHHFNRRPVDMADASCDVVSKKVVQKLKPLLLETFGNIFSWLPESFDPIGAGQLFVLYSPAVVSTLENRTTRAVMNWYRDPAQVQVSWMHTLPFTFDILQRGDVEEWTAINLLYCGQMFRTLEQMVEAEAQKTLTRCSFRPDTAYTWDAAGPDPGTPAASETFPSRPPINVTWQVHRRGSVVWGDWELLATVRPGSGLALHDVRWRGERILYELGQSDAHAYYSAPFPEKQFHYSDKAFSLAQLSADMVAGLDCPEGASFLEGGIWILPRGPGLISDPGNAKPTRLACVFESHGFDGSLWRHAQLLNRRVTGRPLRQLVVRAVSTVGNYDYIADVRFGEDGSIHVRNDFAGYPETEHAAPFRDPPAKDRRTVEGAHEVAEPAPESLDWGTRARGDMVAQLHSHFVVWKVDLDIHGAKNEFHAISTSTALQDGGLPKKSQTSTRLDREDPDALLIARAQTPGLWRVVNPDVVNPSTGLPKGYAVVIESAPAVQTLPASHPFSITGSFAKRHLAVTRRKDDEPSATHSLDHFPITEPLFSVDRFLSDRESLVGEDLVCWVSVGKEHITRSEDIPLVSNFGVQFALLPYNYHEENPAMQLAMVSR